MCRRFSQAKSDGAKMGTYEKWGTMAPLALRFRRHCIDDSRAFKFRHPVYCQQSLRTLNIAFFADSYSLRTRVIRCKITHKSINNVWNSSSPITTNFPSLRCVITRVSVGYDPVWQLVYFNLILQVDFSLESLLLEVVSMFFCRPSRPTCFLHGPLTTV